MCVCARLYECFDASNQVAITTCRQSVIVVKIYMQKDEGFGLPEMRMRMKKGQ